MKCSSSRARKVDKRFFVGHLRLELGQFIRSAIKRDLSELGFLLRREWAFLSFGLGAHDVVACDAQRDLDRKTAE